MKTKRMKMMKKAAFVLALICLTVSVAVLIPNRTASAEEDYGQSAEEYLRHIDASYHERWSMTESNQAMRSWLTDTVTSFGYSPQLLYCEGESPLGWGYYNGYNIVFEKPGQSQETIVVSAHYDSVSTNGCEDNGTGVSVLLELAQRFANIDTKYTIRFILFDIEEPGILGSTYYVNTSDISDVILCLNMDCVGVGDYLYAYGGDFVTDDSGNTVFTRDWGLSQILACADAAGVSLRTIPQDYQGDNVRPPAKPTGSDQLPFNNRGIAYVYLATSYWTSDAATGQQQVSDPAIPNGKIMHVAEYDNMSFIESQYGSRIFDHMRDTSKLMTYMLLNVDHDKKAAELFAVEETETESVTETESISETESITETESISETESKIETEIETESETELQTQSEIEVVTEAFSEESTGESGKTENESKAEETVPVKNEAESNAVTTNPGQIEATDTGNTVQGVKKGPDIRVVILCFLGVAVLGVVSYFVVRRKK